MTKTTTLLATLTIAGLAGSAQATTVLFADNFNRADSTDLNAATTGKSGTLGALNWLEKTTGGDPKILSNEIQLGEDSPGGGGGWGMAWLDRNFTDAVITTNGNFSVSVDILNDETGGNTRWAGIVVGGSATDFSGLPLYPINGEIDFFIGYDGSGTEQFRIYENGSLSETTNLTFANPDTLRVDFTNVISFNAGTLISYEVFNNNSSIADGTFTWSGTNENYLGLYSNWTGGGAEFDNFSVSTVPEPGSLALLGLGGLLIARRRRG